MVVAVVGKINSSYSQSVVLELSWTLGLIEIAQEQVEHFDSYYPSPVTCVSVLRSNLTAQAFGGGSKMKLEMTAQSNASCHGTRP